MIKLVVYQLLFALNCIFLMPYSFVLFSIVSALLAVLVGLHFYRIKKQNQQLATTIFQGLQSLHDGDFSISLATSNQDFDKEIAFFNTVIDKLRKERQHLYQRELLLDKVVNAANVVTLLFNHRDELIFTNLAADSFFHRRDNLIGTTIESLCVDHYHVLSAPLSDARDKAQDAIIYLPDQQHINQAWHLSSSNVALHGVKHTLVLLKPIGEQLNKQELLTWKKVIRVINHELNNSIAPISSLCHSGQFVAKELDNPQLERVFNGISKRINHLGQFIQDYSQLAKIKQPNICKIENKELLTTLQELFDFKIDNQLNTTPIYADKEQLEQVLINLIKNAHQAEEVTRVTLTLRSQHDQICIQVHDNGLGMPSDIMEQAFTPYFSTKQQGSGIGLAICRDIIEAHGGRIHLSNHQQSEKSGFTVSVFLPQSLKSC